MFNGDVYVWMTSGDVKFAIGFLIDPLTALMMVVVTFVSLMVHIYTIGYMADDPGYTRFFSYISLFTFSMLMLVMANNFLQLFFGWEAVGLVSYLLIGFWFTRPTAIYANLKAFLANRVGDFGFVLGIGLIVAFFRVARLRDGVRCCAETRKHGARCRSRRAVAADDRHLHRSFRRRHGQERAGSASRLAAGLDGRPDANLGLDPRGDDGYRRDIHGRAHEPAVRAVRHRAVVRDHHRCDDGAVHGIAGHRPE